MILDRILPSRSALSKLFGPWKLSETPGVLWSGRQSSSGADVSETEALSLSAVFAGVMLLSRILGTLPLGVHRRTTMWGQPASEPATTNPATWVLGTEFNPEMSACIGRRVCEFHRLLWGNGYAKIAWDARGGVAALWPLEPWRVKPERDEDGTMFYHVDGAERVEARDMIHVPLVSFDGVSGRSFIDFAFESLGMSISAQEFAGRFFGNDASPGVILEHPSTPQKQARDEMRESWNRLHQGAANSRKTAVLWGGWKVNNGPMISPKDAQLLDERRFGVEEVARWLNIPPHMLRDLSRATFSNIEHQGIDLVVYSVGLSLKEWEQEYDRKLLDPPKIYCKHNVNALLRGDHAARASFYHALMSDGVLNINEVRELEDLNPIAGGNVHYRPMNMTPVQPPAVPEQTPAPAPAPAPSAPPPDRGPLRALLEHTLARLGRVEINAVRRAAEKPASALARMNEFWEKHQPNMAESLAPVLAVCASGVDAIALADEWCTRSRLGVIVAVGVGGSPAELGERIETMLTAWDKRPAAVALEVVPCQE